MNPVLHEIVKLGMPINDYYSVSKKDQAKLSKSLIARCASVLKILEKKVPKFKVKQDDDFEWIRSCFHLFGEFVQLHFSDKDSLQLAVDAILSFLRASDDGSDFAPYQTLVKLYVKLGDHDNAYTIVTNMKKEFGEEPFFKKILKSATYKNWKKKK